MFYPSSTATKAALNRVFIQPALSTYSKHFEGGFASRVIIADFNIDNDRRTELFIEPVLTAKIGAEYFKGLLQLGFTVPFNQDFTKKYDYQLSYFPLVFSYILIMEGGKQELKKSIYSLKISL